MNILEIQRTIDPRIEYTYPSTLSHSFPPHFNAAIKLRSHNRTDNVHTRIKVTLSTVAFMNID